MDIHLLCESSPETYRIRKHVSIVNLNHHLKHIQRDGHVSHLVKLNHHLKHIHRDGHVFIVNLNHHLKHTERYRDGHVSVVNLNHHLKHIQRDTERWTYVCCETHTEICREMDMCLL